MYLSKRTKIIWSFVLCLFLSDVPYVAAAEMAETQMIPTYVVVDSLSREQAEQNVRKILSDSKVRSELNKYGVDTEEVSQRLASLSDQELKQLSHQMDEARAGGDVGGILIIAVLVLLIIFLAKRI